MSRSSSVNIETTVKVDSHMILRNACFVNQHIVSMDYRICPLEYIRYSVRPKYFETLTSAMVKNSFVASTEFSVILHSATHPLQHY